LINPVPTKTLSVKSYSTLLSQLKTVFIQGMQRIEEEKVRTYWRTGQGLMVRFPN
jgi:hypothetical protein